MTLLTIEIALWLILSAIFTVDGWGSLRETYSDKTYVISKQIFDKDRQHQILLMAQTNYRNALREFISGVLWLGIGIGAAITILLTSPATVKIYTIVFPVSLFVVLATHTVIKRLNRRDRKTIIRDSINKAVNANKHLGETS